MTVRVRSSVLPISIHALHEESDLSRAPAKAGREEFQSTLSMRRATINRIGLTVMAQFQSTLSMRRATFGLNRFIAQIMISIHALHEESDLRQFQHQRLHIISIHALHEESDRLSGGFTVQYLHHFNPRSP